MDAASLSTALTEANRRLYQLRNDCQGARRSNLETSAVPSVQNTSERAPGFQLAGELPPHLGWDSPAVTASIQAANNQSKPTNHQQPTTNHRSQIPAPRSPSIKLHPDIAIGMLKTGKSAPGRLWLLLRHLDQAGRGQLRIDVVKKTFTDKSSTLRLCGRRQLRNLLRQGRGVFWEIDESPKPTRRIWLKSTAKVARALSVARLSCRPVELPLEELLNGIGRARAHFYASYHSGRTSGRRKHHEETPLSAPISRTTLTRLTHVPERTQRAYEQVTGLEKRGNIAIGPAIGCPQGHAQGRVIDSEDSEICRTAVTQERAWKHGRATFEFTDKKGRYGMAGQRFLAWRLPNSYRGCHVWSPRGRQKKINRQIDLVIMRAQGNGLVRDETRAAVERLFHPNSCQAGKAYNRKSQVDAFWPDRSKRPGPSQIWLTLPAGDDH